MPRGHSPYMDDPYSCFVADVRLAYIRATSFDRPNHMSRVELDIVNLVHDWLIRLDPEAANVNPNRSMRRSAQAYNS